MPEYFLYLSLGVAVDECDISSAGDIGRNEGVFFPRFGRQGAYAAFFISNH